MSEVTFLSLFFNINVALEYLPELLWGAWITIALSFSIILTGLFLGLILALWRRSAHRYTVVWIRFVIDCFRAVPPLAVVLLLYFGLPSFGIMLSAFWVMWLTLSLILASFAEEIFWAGLCSVSKGQWEAGRSSGLTNLQTIRYIVLPQAFKICIPPLTNRSIAITKNTALGTAIGMPELLNEAQIAQSFSGSPTPLVLAALGYLIIFIPMISLAGKLERKMSWGGKL